MKPTEIEPIGPVASPIGLHSDRLTQLLIWVTFFLLAALAAVGADLWLWPASDGPVAEAVGLTPTTYSPTATPQPTASPTVPPTESPTMPPTALPTMPPTASPTMSPTASPTMPPTAPPTVPPTAPSASNTPEPKPSTPVTPPACVPPEDWTIHVVQLGNTLRSLARRYGTDINSLMQVNCLNTNTIFIGQRLYVPGPSASPTVLSPLITDRSSATATPRPGASATPPAELAPRPTASPTATPQAALLVNIPDEYLNIVLLGSDRRPGAGHWRTDSIIIVSVDTSNNIVRLLSIPRDLWVYIPGHGYNRINTADLWGELAKSGSGPDRVKQTIHHNLGIPIHYYVRIDFQGFIEIIDTVGGIDVDVDCPLPDIDLSAGMHHMEGKEALRYARSRKSTNDFDRGRRQRKVLMALWDQALTLDIIPRLPELWRVMAGSYQTDLSLQQVINLAYVGVKLKPQRILSRAIGSSLVQGWSTPLGASVLLPRNDKIRSMLESFYAPLDVSRLDATDQVRVQVLNGSQRRQAEQLAAAALRWDGFQVAGSGQADRLDYDQTQIRVFSDRMGAAQQIASLLRVPSAVVQDLRGIQEQPDPSQPVDIQVILGRDYNPCQR